MDALLQELASLSDSDLCKELKSAGLPFGGISKATRKFFEKRLATHKLKEQGLGKDDGNLERREVQSAEGQDKVVPASGESKKEDPAKSGQAVEQKEAGDPITKSSSSGTQRVVTDVVGSGNLSSSYVKGEIVYVVCIPVEGGLGQNDNSAVCSVTAKISQNKKEVLKLMKENTEARFKTFKSLEDAQNFARLQANLTTPKKVNGASNKSEQPAVNDRANSYRTPKPQQLNGLRFVIEKREAEKFKTLVWGNPRYLVTSVDTPTVLHEGCKYNALHVAAMKNLPDMMQLILDTISDPEIPKLLYPGESEESRAGRWDFVTHLYLNSLEKGNGETPLHFASKFGFIGCVQILLDHPKCNKKMANKYGQTASEIICNRYRDNDKEKVKSAIAELLDDHFYIPVWRADDNSLPAVIGEPWSPDVPNNRSALLSEQAKGSPIDSDISLRALAGPMSPSEAVDFQKDWKTPPSSSKKKAAAIRRGDSEKGLERLGRELAHSRKVPWMEYWSFLDDFVDFSTTEGLEILEDYLANRCYELTESSLEKKSSVTKVPAGVMKNLVSEFTSTSTPNQLHVGVNGKTITEISYRCDMDAMGAEKSNKEEMRASTMRTNFRNFSQANQSTHQKNEKSTDAQKLACKLEEMSLSMTEKLERNSGEQVVEKEAGKDNSVLGKNLRMNAGGDSCSVNSVGSEESLSSMPASVSAIGSEQSIKTSSPTLDNIRRVADEPGSKETLDLTALPKVSPTCKPIKNSTETIANSKGMETASPLGATPGSESNRGSNVSTPERKTTAGQMTKLLFSQVQMITDMMAQLTIGSVKRQIVREESDVDTGESSISSIKTEDESEKCSSKERTEGMTASNVNSSLSNEEGHVHHKRNQIASTEPKVNGDSNENPRDRETMHPVASEEHGLTPSTTRSPAGDSASISTVTNMLDSKPDHEPQGHEENASPERTGNGTAEGAVGFQTPENQRLVATPPSVMSPESGILFINGDAPTKVDLHVLRAIESTDVGDRFPFVKRWKQAMEQIPEETRQRWRTPAQTRYGSPHHSGSSPSHQRHSHHHSPLTGGRSPVLQRLRTWSEPINRGVGLRINQGGDSRGVFGRGQSPTGAGLERTPKENLMVSAYMQ